MKELEKLTQGLQDRFDRWEHLKEHGGQDSFWSDGCNMYLVRNHIFYYKNQIKALCKKENVELPEIYHREPPPKVDNDYMAKADEVRKNAKRALAEYKASKDYQYLLSVVKKLNKSQIEQTFINNVMGYCSNLELFIEKDDLVAMRRHERWEHYLKCFWDCRKRIEKILGEDKPRRGQISLFDL